MLADATIYWTYRPGRSPLVMAIFIVRRVRMSKLFVAGSQSLGQHAGHNI